MIRKDSQGAYCADSLVQFDWLEHSFGSCHSDGLARRLPIVRVKQIHSATCLVATKQAEIAGSGDALLTAVPGIYVGVFTADCLPIFLVDERNRVAAAVHAGWRGTVQEIVVHCIAEMRRQHSTRAEDLYGVIGPGIGPCCYEVGAEVASQFRKWFPERKDLGSKTRIDLAETNRRQLLEAGVPSGRITAGAPCTCCSAGDFYSYRRDGRRDRQMVSVIGIRNGA